MDARDEEIRVEHLPIFFRSVTVLESKSRILRELRTNSEREALVHAIKMANNNKNKAAKILGIHRTALYKKMKKLDLPLRGDNT
jgi:transcriptional regulator with PAS, ATPase and Fis domain